MFASAREWPKRRCSISKFRSKLSSLFCYVYVGSLVDPREVVGAVVYVATGFATDHVAASRRVEVAISPYGVPIRSLSRSIVGSTSLELLPHKFRYHVA